MSTKEEVAEIRRLIKRSCRTVSVRMARGTAYGWVDIAGSKEFGYFTPEESKCLRQLGLTVGGQNLELISPEDRSYWLKKLKSRGKPWAKGINSGYV